MERVVGHPSVSGERLKPFFPIPALLVILPLVWLFFRQTWRELDEDAHRHRGAILAEGKSDLRPFVALVMAAIILTMQEYYGGRGFYDEHLRPMLIDARHAVAREDLRDPLRRALRLRLVGDGARRRLRRAVRALEDLLPARLAPRLRPADEGLLQSRVDLPALPRVRAPGDVHRQPPARLRHLLPVLPKRLAELARLPPVGGDVLRAVLRARDVLPRLLARSVEEHASARGPSSRWRSPTA